MHKFGVALPNELFALGHQESRAHFYWLDGDKIERFYCQQNQNRMNMRAASANEIYCLFYDFNGGAHMNFDAGESRRHFYPSRRNLIDFPAAQCVG